MNPKSRKAVALANELERTRRVRGISQVTPLGWLQSRLKMGNKSSSPIVYIVNYEIQLQMFIKGKRVVDESESKNNESTDELTSYNE